jgi:hypothetical protein
MAGVAFRPYDPCHACKIMGTVLTRGPSPLNVIEAPPRFRV